MPAELLLAALAVADAHPLARDRYSLRAALRLDGDRVDALVVLEIPFDVVVKSLGGELQASGVDPASASAREARDAWTASVWKRLADGLVLTVDGVVPAGAWAPSDNRYNGKGVASEGFFLYVVEFRPAGPITLDGDVTLDLVNTGWTDAPMSYSAVVMPGKGWTVTEHSLSGVLPDRPYDLNDPAFWVDDPGLRALRARFVKAEVRGGG